LQKRLSAELKAEIRAMMKNEQTAIAALDEQLWLTDQRLGQRIDELAKVDRVERIVFATTPSERAFSHRPAQSPTPPRTPPLPEPPRQGSAARMMAVEAAKVFMEHAEEATRNGATLSNAEQLERWRSARKKPGSLGASGLCSSAVSSTEYFGDGTNLAGNGPLVSGGGSVGGNRFGSRNGSSGIRSMGREPAEPVEESW